MKLLLLIPVALLLAAYLTRPRTIALPDDDQYAIYDLAVAR